MDVWVAPPNFGSDGSPPPLNSVRSLISEEFTVMKLQENVDNRDGPVIVAAAYAGTLLLKLYKNEDIAAIMSAKEWLERNLGSASLRNIERRRPRRSPLLGAWTKPPDQFTEELYLDTFKRIDARYGDVSLIRVSKYRYWRRDDPITQLSPGVSKKVTSSLIIGLTRNETSETARALGIEASTGSLKASAQVNDRVSQAIATSEQRELSDELTLSNEGSDTLRRIAVWRQVEDLIVERVGIVRVRRPPDAGRAEADLELTWTELVKLEKVHGNVSTTYLDIPVRGLPG